MGQIAQQLSQQAQGHQKTHENVNAVTIRSHKGLESEDEVKFNDSIIEVYLCDTVAELTVILVCVLYSQMCCKQELTLTFLLFNKGNGEKNRKRHFSRVF